MKENIINSRKTCEYITIYNIKIVGTHIKSQINSQMIISTPTHTENNLKNISKISKTKIQNKMFTTKTATATTNVNKRIAVIGAGVSGIIATKCCLEQGHQVVVFDKTTYIGGLWRYHETTDQDGIASVMKSTVINTSKEVSAFSDYPPRADYPNFMHNRLNVINFFKMLFLFLFLLFK